MLERLKDLFSGSHHVAHREALEQVSDGNVQIEGKTYSLKRWSRNLFVVTPCGPHFGEGDEVAIDLTVQLGKETLEINGLAIVVAANFDTQELECRFLDIDRTARVAIDRHFSTIEAAQPS